MSEGEASAYFGQSKLSGRALIKNLLKDSRIEFYISSQKRQTIRRYFSIFIQKKGQKLKFCLTKNEINFVQSKVCFARIQ